MVVRVKALRKQSRELEEEIAQIQSAALAAAGVFVYKCVSVRVCGCAGVRVCGCVGVCM